MRAARVADGADVVGGVVVVMYRASNGVTSAVVLTEAQARADFEAAEHVEGKFRSRFVTYLVGTNALGQRLPMAPTFYVPLIEGDDWPLP